MEPQLYYLVKIKLDAERRGASGRGEAGAPPAVPGDGPGAVGAQFAVSATRRRLGTGLVRIGRAIQGASRPDVTGRTVSQIERAAGPG